MIAMTAPHTESRGLPVHIVVVVPAHNERQHLPRCLRALTAAASCLTTPVSTVVVLDSCDDGSEHLAGEYGPDVHFISIDAGNVGAARAAGFTHARSVELWPGDLVDGVSSDTWYATTDADSMVDADWLVRMVRPDLHAGADMVLGVVRVPNWRHFSPAVVRRYLRAYRSKGPDHDHVHGANMGFRADAYWHVGGFHALATGEDVDLVERFEAAGLTVHRDRGLSVATSDRRDGRAPGGFAQYLRGLSRASKAGAGA